MSYKCDLCHYTTTSKRTFNNHIISWCHSYHVLQNKNNNEIEELRNMIDLLKEKNMVIAEKALDNVSTIANDSNTLANTALNNNNIIVKVASKTLSTIQYAMKYCINAPNIDALDVENKLYLTPRDCHTMMYNPLYIAKVTKSNYYHPENLDFNAFYCKDQARKKFMSKRDGQWIDDPKGEYIKQHITLPIAYKIHAFNEDLFKNTIAAVGGVDNLTDGQIRQYDKNVKACATMITDKIQNKIVSKLISCTLIKKK
jgi:hypothetical protein